MRYHPSRMAYSIRGATLADRPAIEQLIIASARGLSRADYSEQQIEGAIKTVFGVDTNLILDGTYFVADNGGELIGCGGLGKGKRRVGGGQHASLDHGRRGSQTEDRNNPAVSVDPTDSREG